MGKTRSPLRYPGGKSKMYKNIRNLIEAREYADRIYVEPYAGGFGVGIALLEDGVIHNAIMNDVDPHIFHFWDAVLNETDALVDLIRSTEITLSERDRQKQIYYDNNSKPLLDAFATLFLNRVNYSGVLFAGPIGGKRQESAYPLNCRFNKENMDCIRKSCGANSRKGCGLGKNCGFVFYQSDSGSRINWKNGIAVVPKGAEQHGQAEPNDSRIR